MGNGREFIYFETIPLKIPFNLQPNPMFPSVQGYSAAEMLLAISYEAWEAATGFLGEKGTMGTFVLPL